MLYEAVKDNPATLLEEASEVWRRPLWYVAWKAREYHLGSIAMHPVYL